MDAPVETDVLVIGSGIAGLQSALDLADRGFKVLVAEREASTGGKMIALSKVFPTMDCASCITTPRMSAVAHHDNITTWTYVDVESIVPAGDGFVATITQKPRYVDEGLCIGCRLCEYACPVEVPHEFEGGMGARRAAYIPFGTAIPQTALIDIDACVYCGKCEKACPTDAIDFAQVPRTLTVNAHSVVLATGYRTTPVDAKKEYRGGSATNVIGALDMERLLAPNGPYGRVLRPSDGKIPDSVAYIQCAGSRDETLGVPYCSRVCCMYAIKQAMLLSGALPMADITIYYMDIRTFGKGYEQFYQTARSMGINFVKAKVARIDEQAEGDLTLRVEMIEEDGRVVDAPHDLVVLSVGMQPGDDPRRFINVDLDLDKFIATPEPKLDATLTSLPGVVAAGTALGPKDIVDTVVEASAAATKVALYLGPPALALADQTNLHVEVRELSAAEAVMAAGLTEVHGA
ncbi:MAG: CoB--CoM heterodisulfide reductase iron-sulfur subunit A family protein [Candidatus Limnocylindrales bacterium]|nr:CoB--CoM heterodisulfide reductase iron-sulfur subunit A family protein [Candidatus Limnocylindrales bacterium]